MNAQAAFCLAATSQALSVFALGFTAPSDLLRPAIAVVVAWLTWLFNESIHDALQSRLHVALLSTGMWIQCLKTFDDLCLSKLSFDQEAGTSPKTAVGQLQFGLGNLWNMRGVGTSKQISQIPPWSYTNPLVPSRGRESTRHVRNAVVSFLILDVFANQPPPDLENMMSPRNEQLFSRLGEVNAEEAIFRFFASFGFWLNTFCVIQLINSLFSLLRHSAYLPATGGKLASVLWVRLGCVLHVSDDSFVGISRCKSRKASRPVDTIISYQTV
ncbi:membrane bound O-acyl transferase family-domain-containing protein [Fusarium acuminatum]|uniref:Membrane bound O-acyl transferase family-domain-containing protein n=1 Tax=Fusarium acuminatum TaxID=5515 RepID=A0ABZ2X560_9HYPO